MGERVVADCAMRCSPAHHVVGLVLRYGQVGELISRLTADTTQIKAAVGASVSIALRNVVLFFGSPP